MNGRLEFEREVSWDEVTTDTDKAFLEYAKEQLGREITEDDIEDYTVTIKIEVSLF